MSSVRHPFRRGDERGQALVEFSLAIIVFIVMLVAVFDVGHGVYLYNGVSEAAREIARVTAVHPGLTLGASDETAERIAIQRGLVGDIVVDPPACVNVDGSSSTHNPCQSGDYVRVTVTASYRPLSLLGFGGPITVSSSSSIRLP
jgi:Flp pilus assembly protein TadG